MSRVLAIDPGNTHSGWALIDSETCEPMHFGKTPNVHLRTSLIAADYDVEADHAVIEMVASYGMAVGSTVFDTCVWIGRFAEAVRCNWYPNSEPELVFRRDVKLHHCGQTKAKDTNIRQALVDRFAPGQPNHGKGTKAQPGWFHGFHADVWQAYALAVLAADRIENRPGIAA